MKLTFFECTQTIATDSWEGTWMYAFSLKWSEWIEMNVLLTFGWSEWKVVNVLFTFKQSEWKETNEPSFFWMWDEWAVCYVRRVGRSYGTAWVNSLSNSCPNAVLRPCVCMKRAEKDWNMTSFFYDFVDNAFYYFFWNMNFMSFLAYRLIAIEKCLRDVNNIGCWVKRLVPVNILCWVKRIFNADSMKYSMLAQINIRCWLMQYSTLIQTNIQCCFVQCPILLPPLYEKTRSLLQWFTIDVLSNYHV